MEITEGMHRYAEVLVKIGLDLKEGQAVCIEAPVEQSAFAAVLAEEAYRAGAGRCEILWQCGGTDRVKMLFGETPLYDCNALAAEFCASLGAGYIRLESPDLGAFEGIAPDKIAKRARESAAIRGVFRKKAFLAGQTAACVPSQKWADLVYPDLPEGDRMNALWQAVLVCARCDQSDPVGAWKRYLADTARRKRMLDEKRYRRFHFCSAKTDLTICPAEGEMWRGSCIPMKDRVPVPNIPTEEIFLAPSKYQVNGHVVSTKPLNYQGQLIEGISLTFRDGRIVDFGAQKGEELLKEIIETDEGSHYLGEMALVDQASGVARQNRIFYTTLYDENASCHLAIGNAICQIQDPEEKERRGYNISAVHVDFMIGSDDMCVRGQRENGEWEDIFVNGHWV
ncbi:MAG: aminopeptidase [Eubacteriales bacterium]|nr:aminopeptidase [Eubacteriales bacterium]